MRMLSTAAARAGFGFEVHENASFRTTNVALIRDGLHVQRELTREYLEEAAGSIHDQAQHILEELFSLLPDEMYTTVSPYEALLGPCIQSYMQALVWFFRRRGFLVTVTRQPETDELSVIVSMQSSVVLRAVLHANGRESPYQAVDRLIESVRSPQRRSNASAVSISMSGLPDRAAALRERWSASDRLGNASPSRPAADPVPSRVSPLEARLQEALRTIRSLEKDAGTAQAEIARLKSENAAIRGDNPRPGRRIRARGG